MGVKALSSRQRKQQKSTEMVRNETHLGNAEWKVLRSFKKEDLMSIVAEIEQEFDEDIDVQSKMDALSYISSNWAFTRGIVRNWLEMQREQLLQKEN